MTPLLLPKFNDGASCLYVSDFNSHHMDWGYTQANADVLCLAQWTSSNGLKEANTFHSARSGSGTNPDLAFTSDNQPSLPTRRELDRFPRSQHRPCLILQAPLVPPISGRTAKRWNSRKADWAKFRKASDAATTKPPDPLSVDIDAGYSAYCDSLQHTATHSMPWGYGNDYIPGWNKERQELYDKFLNTDDQWERYLNCIH